MKNSPSKKIIFASILLFLLYFVTYSLAMGQENEDLENPFSNGLMGIKKVNVSVAFTRFVFSISSKADIDYKVVRGNVEYELKSNGIRVTEDPKEKDATIIVEIHGTPVNSNGKTIAFSYSITLKLMQDVYLARKEKQFLAGAVTWSKTIANFALKENLKSTISNDLQQLLDQFILLYHKAN